MSRLIDRFALTSDSEQTPQHATSAAEIGAFIELLAREYFLDGPDRRAEPRIRLTLAVVLHAVDRHSRLQGHPVRAVTRDISSSGIGLVCQDPVSDKYLTVHLQSPCGAAMNLVAEVLRCSPIGYYYDVGCRFVVA